MAIGLGVKCIARILRNPATLVTPTLSRSGINISHDHKRQVRSITEQTTRTVMKMQESTTEAPIFGRWTSGGMAQIMAAIVSLLLMLV
jgi:hypothetical protein